MRQPITLGRDLCGDLDQALLREWLVTNGLGGFGAGTIAGCQTRRYHGLLVAAEKPPVGRTMRLVDLDVMAELGGRHHELGCHEYADGTVHPTGHRLIESFVLDGTVPTWTYAIGAADEAGVHGPRLQHYLRHLYARALARGTDACDTAIVLGP